MNAAEVQTTATWIPPTLLVWGIGIVIALVGVVLTALMVSIKLHLTTFTTHLNERLATLDRRMEKLDATTEEQDKVIAGLAKSVNLDKLELRFVDMAARLGGFMTTEQGGRLGDRMDGRITNLAERLAVLEATAQRIGNNAA